jgi:hypothetical protein
VSSPGVCPLPIRAAHNLTFSIRRNGNRGGNAVMPPHVAYKAGRRPRTVGMVSFDVSLARIDAKGLGRVGHDLGVKRVPARVGGRPGGETSSILRFLIHLLACLGQRRCAGAGRDYRLPMDVGRVSSYSLFSVLLPFMGPNG